MSIDTSSAAPTVPTDLTDLPSVDTAGRVARLRPLIEDAGADALIVTEMANIRYLTGFTGSSALLAVLPEGLALVTDGRYQEQVVDELTESGVEAEVLIGRTGPDQRDHLAGAVAGLRSLALEADHVTWARQQAFAEEWFPESNLVATTGLIGRLRLVKDAGEQARIGAACAVADAALAAVRHRLAERPTEAEVALELEGEMRRRGAEGPSFDTIVASGPNGARPHHRAGDRRIDEGDLVVIDFGALVDGYHSDMTRTLSVGELSSTQERMYEVVAEAQAAGVAATRAGVTAVEVDEACRKVIRNAGWEDAFVHSTGHGVGLDVHEEPRVAATSDATLVAGHVVTIEPGVYLPEHGGVRIEDIVVVTPDGCRVLTRAPKDRSI